MFAAQVRFTALSVYTVTHQNFTLTVPVPEPAFQYLIEIFTTISLSAVNVFAEIVVVYKVVSVHQIEVPVGTTSTYIFLALV